MWKEVVVFRLNALKELRLQKFGVVINQLVYLDFESKIKISMSHIRRRNHIDFRSIVFNRKGGYKPKTHIMERYSVLRIRYSFLMGPLDKNFQQYVPHGFIFSSTQRSSHKLFDVTRWINENSYHAPAWVWFHLHSRDEANCRYTQRFYLGPNTMINTISLPWLSSICQEKINLWTHVLSPWPTTCWLISQSLFHCM
jgi:hypothetical protein